MFLWASRRSAPDPEGPSRGDDMDTYDVGRDFQVVRMRRADGAALAVRRERLVSRSSLTLEPPLVVAPVWAPQQEARWMTGMVAGVDFIGLLLAERLRRERGAGATARLPSAAARFG